MYYSSERSAPSLFDRAPAAIVAPAPKRRFKAWLLLLPILGAGGGWYAWHMDNVPTQAVATVDAAPTPIPTNHPEVAGVSFGDIMAKQPSYQGWLAGVNEGSVVMIQPDSGSMNTLTEAKNEWYGPISQLAWSPDHSKLAYLVIPTTDADALTQNAADFAKQHGFASIPTPGTFPFGNLAILDITSKQVTVTKVEARNMPRSITWADNQTLLAVSQALSQYSLKDGSTTVLSAAGGTNPNELLQAPLVYQADSQTIYFTKVTKGDTQSVRMVMALHLGNNQVEQVAPLKTGDFDAVTTSAGTDLALSDDGKRLALLSQDGISYRTLDDGGMHSLPYKDEWVWLKQSTLSDLEWLSPSKLAFTSLSSDGSKVWGVWDIPSSNLYTFGKGSLAGSWDVSSGRLALVLGDGNHIGLLSPNWDDQNASVMKTLPLPWEAVSW